MPPATYKLGHVVEDLSDVPDALRSPRVAAMEHANSRSEKIAGGGAARSNRHRSDLVAAEVRPSLPRRTFVIFAGLVLPDPLSAMPTTVELSADSCRRCSFAAPSARRSHTWRNDKKWLRRGPSITCSRHPPPIHRMIKREWRGGPLFPHHPRKSPSLDNSPRRRMGHLWYQRCIPPADPPQAPAASIAVVDRACRFGRLEAAQAFAVVADTSFAAMCRPAAKNSPPASPAHLSSIPDPHPACINPARHWQPCAAACLDPARCQSGCVRRCSQ